jgi:hypothetical protein
MRRRTPHSPPPVRCRLGQADFWYIHAMKKSELAQLSFRARIAVLALAALCALHGMSFILYWLQLDILERVQQKEVVPQVEALASDERVRIVALMVAVGWTVTGALFLRWLHFAYARANDFGRKDQPLVTPGQAVVAFFIPLYGLVRPFRHMRNLLQISDPNDIEVLPEVTENEAATYRDSARRILPRAPWKVRDVVGLWWGAYLGSCLISLAITLSSRHPSQEIGALISSTRLAMLNAGAVIVAGVLCLCVIQDVTRSLLERARRLRLLRRRNRTTSAEAT